MIWIFFQLIDQIYLILYSYIMDPHNFLSPVRVNAILYSCSYLPRCYIDISQWFRHIFRYSANYCDLFAARIT